MDHHQWYHLLSNTTPSLSILHSINSLHSPEAGLGLLQTFFCEWKENHQDALIDSVIKESHLGTLSNTILLSWFDSLQWDHKKKAQCMNMIRKHCSVSFKKHYNKKKVDYLNRFLTEGLLNHSPLNHNKCNNNQDSTM